MIKYGTIYYRVAASHRDPRVLSTRVGPSPDPMKNVYRKPVDLARSPRNPTRKPRPAKSMFTRPGKPGPRNVKPLKPG